MLRFPKLILRQAGPSHHRDQKLLLVFISFSQPSPCRSRPTQKILLIGVLKGKVSTWVLNIQQLRCGTCWDPGMRSSDGQILFDTKEQLQKMLLHSRWLMQTVFPRDKGWLLGVCRFPRHAHYAPQMRKHEITCYSDAPIAGKCGI